MIAGDETFLKNICINESVKCKHKNEKENINLVCICPASCKSDDSNSERGANLIYETGDPRGSNNSESRHMLQRNMIAGFSNLTNWGCSY